MNPHTKQKLEQLKPLLAISPNDFYVVAETNTYYAKICISISAWEKIKQVMQLLGADIEFFPFAFDWKNSTVLLMSLPKPYDKEIRLLLKTLRNREQ